MNNTESRLHSAPLELICSEVNSKCQSLRAASRLLPELYGQDSKEILLLMIDEATQLTKSLQKYREGAQK